MTEAIRFRRLRRIGVYAGALALGASVPLIIGAGGPSPEIVSPPAAPAARQVGSPAPARQLSAPDSAVPRALASVDESRPADADAATPLRAPSVVPTSVAPDEPAPATPVAPTTTEAAAAKATPPASPTTTAAAPPTTRRRANPTTTTTTAAPTPTTQAVAAGEAPPVTIQRFTDWPIRNTSLDARTQFVNTPASQLNWRSFTEPSDRVIQLGSVTANKHLGQFRTQCSFSHFAYDDPLIHPGRPGSSHLHMFFGNSQANASSTYTSLRDTGSSSCNGLEGNRTAYWVPAVFDASGNARIPSRIEVYYKSHDRAFANVAQPPAGLGMVAGQAATNPFIQWGCQEAGAQGTNLNRPVVQRQNTIPRCSGTATLLAHIQFPQCLSGSVGPNTGNASAQLQYPTRGFFTNTCPAGTQYITAIEYFIAWAPNNHDGNTDRWWLASDVRHDGGGRAPNGSTLHGDWFGAWNPGLMDQIHQNCVARLAECGWDLVDNNRRITWVEHFGPRSGTAYQGRRAIPAAELSAALCPDDPFARAEDAATCASRSGH